MEERRKATVVLFSKEFHKESKRIHTERANRIEAALAAHDPAIRDISDARLCVELGRTQAASDYRILVVLQSLAGGGGESL